MSTTSDTGKRKRLFIMLVFILAAIIGATVGYFILPDTLVVQFSASGVPSNTMPKLLGLALPIGITVLFSFLFYANPENKKYLIGSVAGIVVLALTFIFNLKG